MSDPQPGIFDEAARFHHHLEFDLRAGADGAALKQAVRALGVDRSGGDGVAVVGFGPDAWRGLAPDRTPDDFRGFTALGDPAGFYAPATQGDLWIWFQGPAPDVLLDRALAATRALRDLGDARHEVAGFAYHGNRDLIGFVDGTGNPKDDQGKRSAALIPGTGAAYAMTQRWVHDLAAFEALDIAEQEKVVGRTKIEDVELTGDDMPPDSHVARTDVSLDGVALKVYRRSTPYGTAREHGLHYVAFACDLVRFDVQLERMFGTSGDGIHDRLVEYSRALSGAYWYVPGLDELAAL